MKVWSIPEITGSRVSYARSDICDILDEGGWKAVAAINPEIGRVPKIRNQACTLFTGTQQPSLLNHHFRIF